MLLPRFALLLVLLAATSHAAAAADHPVIALYADGAPGSEARRGEPEKVEGSNVSNIHNPTLTVYLPEAGRATGVAVVVAPGGGHQRLAIQHEGYNIAAWLSEHGIAAFVLKYRLARDSATPAGTPQAYTIDRDAVGDAQRAIRLIRSRAAEWHIDASRVGIMGFSAGGEVAAVTAIKGGEADPSAKDALDRIASRPDFQVLIYPGQSQRIEPGKGAPPAFLACGSDDRPDISEGLPKAYLRFKEAHVPVELHIYAKVAHGFGYRPERPSPSDQWLGEFHSWLVTLKFIAETGTK
jgi:endo-1,4-beta-xylanase